MEVYSNEVQENLSDIFGKRICYQKKRLSAAPVCKQHTDDKQGMFVCCRISQQPINLLDRHIIDCSIVASLRFQIS